ncbi:MAG: phosphogluconate dehydrogenase [Magnetovibrio sp.]|nr:phosphogluconate dehydrogenase [Magnetovibrio sp.]
MSGVTSDKIRLAFIGFGEVGQAIAAGLSEAGVSEIVAYDILLEEHYKKKLIQTHACSAGITLAGSHAEAVSGKDLIISAVTCKDAIIAACQVAPYLEPEQTYIDLNSVSPATKKKVQKVIESAGATFLEASIMSPILPRRHAAPMLLSGPAAPEIIQKLSPFGMHLTDIGPQFGRASATKMFRSIIIKGLEALLQECLIAASKYDVTDTVLESINDNHPEIDWKSMADYYLSRTVIHGTRRAEEMDEVAETLIDMDIEPFMAKCTSKRIRWLANQNLNQNFNRDGRITYRNVIELLNRVKT